MSSYPAAVVAATAVLVYYMQRRRRNLQQSLPVAIATWKFGSTALSRAGPMLEAGSAAVDAVEAGVNAVELDTSDQFFVGYGGLPNGEGTMEMDSAIMDGARNGLGVVMALPQSRQPISVARSVMERSIHNVFVGQGARKFASKEGHEEEEALFERSKADWEKWLDETKQEAAVVQKGAHDRHTKQDESSATAQAKLDSGKKVPGQHDTIGLICIDKASNISVGTSTSGWAFCPAGRVGDSPLVGSGLFVDNNVGAAAATGDGEEIMKVIFS
jgi:isoaspartyl peptidase/L-asparaginase-like protein (Ntn-hydrolase superfamily)